MSDMGCRMPDLRLQTRRVHACRFTLIEIIAVVSVAALLLTGLLVALRGTVLRREQEDTMAREDAVRQHCLDVVSRDLRGIVPPSASFGTTFLGDTEEADESRRDTVEFATCANSPRHGAFGGDLIQVSYSMVQEDRNAPGVLVRSVQRNLLSTDEEDPEEQTLIDGVRSLKFTYYDGEDWVDSWDSALTEDSLPKAVTVRIERAADLDAEFAETLELTVPILAVAPPEETQSQEGGR